MKRQMDWTNLLKKEKELSSLQLEKSDVTYQIWELGRVLARISEACWRIRDSLDKPGEGEDLSVLVKRVGNLLISLQSLYNKLSRDPMRILGTEEDLRNKIQHLFGQAKEITKIQRVDDFNQKIEDLRDLIVCDLLSTSVHLCNIFFFSLGLRTLKAKLMYDINSTKIEGIIKDNIELLEKLEKGDKILASPNLEIIPRNLEIIKLRLKGIEKHLSDLREYAQKDKTEFKKKLEERCNFWMDLILDVKSPSDYLSLGRRIFNRIIPFLFCYYIIVIPIVIVIEFRQIIFFNSTGTPKIGKELATWLIPLITPLVPLLIFFYWWIFHWIKDWLIILSFRFRISQFKLKP